MNFKTLICLLPLALTVSCSTIDKKDCQTDMHELGLRHGRMGSPKIYTDQIRNVCSHLGPKLDLEQYELGFKKGWDEYCKPINALALGKADDMYASFCPSQREPVFREKFLIGKQIHELRDQEMELIEEWEKLKAETEFDSEQQLTLKRTEKELTDLRKQIQQLEIEGLKDTLTLMNHL